MNTTSKGTDKPKGLSTNLKKWIYIGISVILLLLIMNVSFPESVTSIDGASLTEQGQSPRQQLCIRFRCFSLILLDSLGDTLAAVQ